MAANLFSVSPVMVSQQTHHNGHEILYNFLLCNAAALQEEWSFTQDYQAPCQISPTSWKFRVTLKRAPSSLLVSGSVKLKRNDSINNAVKVFIVMRINHDEFREYFPFPTVNIKIEPGEEICVNICDIVPNPSYRYLLCQELSVMVSIYITKCHQHMKKRFRTTDTRSGMERMHFSKM
ncbi:hypothetical protein AVEN_215756-1 [Araneus ventricosus]|uniref:MATH domain-containing protein n=1 Tax=Araneus ventricosus TaxID=182803 RepID=A0A4Y2JPM5_ARAVE|nr:hypothetical protein AVEN_215756-1 [Araneus ventricosus]